MDKSLRLNGKDLINIGIFTAIYCVASIGFFMLGFIPFCLPLYTVFIPMISGIIFMLFLTKVKKFGMILLMSILLGILMLLTGMSFYALIIGTFTGLISEFVYKSGKYQSSKKAVITNGVFSIWVWSNFLPLFLNPDSYFASRNFGEEYAQTVVKLLPMWMCPLLLISSFLFGIIGGASWPHHNEKAFRKSWNYIMDSSWNT